MFPSRITLVTYNLWNTKRWDVRQPALEKFLEIYNPDILCIQELRTETRDFIDATLIHHQRVHDDLLGWACEGNIYWNANLFSEVEHGAEDIGMLEENRRMFWVRLKRKDADKTIFVSTAHFTYQRHPQECETSINPRIRQAQKTIEALQNLTNDNEPVFFMGDLNDNIHPPRLLHDAGYVSCFASLGLLPPTTHPCLPTTNILPGDRVANQTIDWLVANQHCKAVSAQVPQFYFGDIAPSDHWPVLAVYEI